MYFLAIVFPPLAVLVCGKPFQAVLNLFLCCLFIIPGWIHAFAVVNSHKNERNANRIENAIIGAARVAHKDAVEIANQLKPKPPYEGVVLRSKDIQEFKKNPDKFIQKR